MKQVIISLQLLYYEEEKSDDVKFVQEVIITYVLEKVGLDEIEILHPELSKSIPKKEVEKKKITKKFKQKEWFNNLKKRADAFK
ncbi:MAG: hypothetical protein U9N18_04385 [Campylobacterota bacterium]|nr:hypothetical protein [Campylobacterota bacterium]